MKGPEKIPITLGIIGKNDAVITKEHRLQIKQLFKDLASAYPNSPLYLFTTITQETNRSAAGIFIDMKNDNEEYKEKFELIIPMVPGDENNINESDIETNRLLNHAKRKFCLNCKSINDRSRNVVEMLRFVADSSLILIALESGQEEEEVISDIINYKRTGDEEDVEKNTFEYDRTVFVIPCNRNATSGQNSEVQKNSTILALDQVLKDTSIREALEKIEEINSDGIKINPETLSRSQNFLIKNQEKLDDQQNSILNLFSVLDVLSLNFHKRYSKVVIWLFVTGLFIIMSFGIYTNVWMSKIMLTIAILFIVLAGAVFYYSRMTKDHTKYLYNRTLAEALRIQFYWNIAGINNNVADYILRIHRKEFIWIEHILSSVYGITYNNNPITAEAISDLTRHWVKNQADFFELSISRMNQKMVKYKSISNISFAFALVLLISIFFLENVYVRNSWMNSLQVVIGTLLGIFALTRGFIQIKGYGQLLNQYELMSVLYHKAEDKISSLISLPQQTDKQLAYLKELFFIIGKESLIELGTWYLILKEKEPGIEGI